MLLLLSDSSNLVVSGVTLFGLLRGHSSGERELRGLHCWGCIELKMRQCTVSLKDKIVINNVFNSNCHCSDSKISQQYCPLTFTTCLMKNNSHFYSARNARIASAVLATAIPSVRLSVRLSVRPSHAGIVSKRRHVARCSLHRWIAKCV